MRTSETQSDFVSVQVAATESGATASFVRRQIKAGLLPATKGKVRVADVLRAQAANLERIGARQAMQRDGHHAAVPNVRKIELVRVDAIDMLPGRRPLNPTAVKVLAESMKLIGLQSPVAVRYVANRQNTAYGSDDSYVLVAGGHRLAAAKLLGWVKIETFGVTGDDASARLLEISENLHRADLTKLERDEQIAEWVKLTEGVSDNLSETQREGRPGAAAAASRELGIVERDVQRAVKVASLAPEAKQAARDAGLDDNRSALLAAAQETTPEAQVAALVNRRPIDQGKLDRDLRLRAISEISLLINDHIPADMRIAIRKNFEVLGSDCKAIAAAIERVEARRR
jgi:ParB/RepB/Spo0J family partition protein